MTGPLASLGPSAASRTAMSRPSTGTIRTRKTARGVVFGAQVGFRGERIYVRFGGSWEGWTRERAESELDYITKQIQRGEWLPPAPEEPAPMPREAWRFRDVAAVFLANQAPRLPGGVEGKSYRDLAWWLSVAVDHVGDTRIDKIHEGVVDEMVVALLKERERIDEAAARGEPEYEEYTDTRTGKRHRRRARGLSRGSINKILAAVLRVLKDAKRRRLIEQLPDVDEARVKPERPRRPYLEVDQAVGLIAQAREIERRHAGLTWEQVHAIRSSSRSAVVLAREYKVSDVLIGKIRRGELWTHESPRRRNDIPRAAVVTTLVLAGVRISELCKLDREHVDLPGARLRVPRVKTEASERVIPLVPALHEGLLDQLARADGQPTDPLFPNRNGGRQTPDNVRSRILVPAGREVGLHGTPHMLRRTFASILAELGVPPRRAMYLLGHTNPTLTMAVYQQVLDVAAVGTEARLRDLLGCELDAALQIFSGRQSWTQLPHHPTRTSTSA